MVDWIERNRGHLLVVLINATITLVVMFWLRRPSPPAMELVPVSTPTSVPISTPTSALLRVYVTGAVQRPDVYELPASSIVKDALIAAGGATTDADLERINLASALHNEQHVHVPRRGEPTEQPAEKGAITTSEPSSERLDINTATAEELTTLPGIGPALAERIVAWREAHGPFTDIAEIKQVPGIGDAIFARIQPYITVAP
ncbi:MAG: ComEA family DNA-binding protein [Anaerolineae bacterium]|nr:ComEA family DNA-binding protein [Anaerolineae bacterium]MDW8070815.1 ComEA family DNA-binding protein [Anaerolineae bacterium]